MSAGIFMQSNGDMLLASIKQEDSTPMIEIGIMGICSGESAVFHIKSLEDLRLFTDLLRNIKYDFEDILNGRPDAFSMDNTKQSEPQKEVES